MSIIFAHIMRVISSIFGVLSDKDNDETNILVLNALSNFFCGIQYFLLGAITGGITCFVAMPRNVLFYKYKNKLPFYILFTYLIILVLCNYKEVDSLLTFIPVSLVIVYTLGLYSNNKLVLKCSILLTCFLEIIYDVHYNAYIGIAVCIVDIIFVTASVIKLSDDNNKKLEKV